MKNLAMILFLVLLSISITVCKKDSNNIDNKNPHDDSNLEAETTQNSIAADATTYEGKIPYIYRVANFDAPFTMYADLKGNGKTHKIKVTQTSYKRAETAGDKNTAIVHIKVYDKNKVVFEYKKRSSPILYIQVVRFPIDESDLHRDIVFFIVEPGDNYMNILCWESRIGRSEKSPTAMLEGYVFEGEYRYVETDIEINTVYG